MATSNLKSAAADRDRLISDAEMRAQIAEEERLRVVSTIRTASERRRGYMGMVAFAAVVMLVSRQLRGTVGALLFSVSTMLVIWGAVDIVRISNQCGTLKERQLQLIKNRDAALEVAREARNL